MSERGKNGTKKGKTPIEKKAADKPLVTKKGIDGRANQRIPIQLLVDYKSGGNYLFDFCRDLGAGGVFIETSNPLPHGSQVELTFTLPDSKETLETKGKVIWVQSAVPGKDLTPGMGVQFEAFDASQRKMLEQFVQRYHGDSFKFKNDKRTAV